MPTLTDRRKFKILGIVLIAAGVLARTVTIADRTVMEDPLVHTVDLYGPDGKYLANVEFKERALRLPLRFADIPQNLKNAILSAEDKRFYQHAGLDPIRLAGAAYEDVKEGRKAQGASTLTMQLARTRWLDGDKNFGRKLKEVLYAGWLELRLPKERIFEQYANHIYLGRSENYNIHGFGQAARTYFGKNVKDLTLAEAAGLAGLVQRPAYLNPARNPEGFIRRRNLVLSLMQRNSYIDDAEMAAAQAEPLQVAPRDAMAGAGYYLDMLAQELAEKGWEGRRLDVSLDPDLQRAAAEAVEAGMRAVERTLGRYGRPGRPQVALVALDPKTGAVRALIGGRDYGDSQLNHALRARQPGSIFKPFVYAAAFQAVASRQAGTIFTPASTVEDEPTTFQFGRELYTPANHSGHYHGTVTLRRALAKSANVATIKVAEDVGFRKVVDLARSAGLNDRIQATPSVALGSYEATPLEMAGAYTVFANQGRFSRPALLAGQPAETREVLPAPVAYQMVSMLEEVLRSGTGASVHSRGFSKPAAGKTGTSRDGWFAGFTDRLLCVVWVGYDDNRDLGLGGSESALPIWTELMKRSLALYGEPQWIKPPKGVSGARICPDSGGLAGSNCPTQRWEFFLPGTEPHENCPLHANVGTEHSFTD